MNGKSKYTITLLFSLLLGLALIMGGCSSSSAEADQQKSQGSGLPLADDRGVGTSAGRVDPPPGERDSFRETQTRTEKESRDPRMDREKPNDPLARADTSANDPGGGGSQGRTGNRKGSAEDSRTNVAAMAGKGNAGRESERGKTAGRRVQTLTEPPAQGEVVVVRKRWAKIRRAPKQNSSSIALAYGNDKFKVVNTNGEWVQVRFGRKNQHKGWLPLSDLSK